MCVAIFAPSDGVITKELARNCWERNPDGAGFAFIRDREVVIYKELNDFEKFWRKLRDVRRDMNLDMIVHFRIATHGSINEENCHPFKVGEDVVFAHNGILSKYTAQASSAHGYGYTSKYGYVATQAKKQAAKEPKACEDISDTRLLGRKMLSQIDPQVLFTPAIRTLLADHIGGGNKLVMLNTFGDSQIVNEQVGDWHQGVWYSNGSYKGVPKATQWDIYSAGGTSYNNSTKNIIKPKPLKGSALYQKPIKNDIEIVQTLIF